MTSKNYQVFDSATERKTLHFDLSHIGEQEDLRVRANMRDYPLKKHDAESLGAAIQKMPVLGLLPGERVTHYIEDLPVPATRPSLITATIPARLNGRSVRRLVAMHIHIPEKSIAATKADREAILKGHEVHPKLACYGLTARDFTSPEQDPLNPQNGYNTPIETANALMFHHNCLTHIDPNVASNVLSICSKYSTNDLVPVITMMGPNWTTELPVLDPTDPSHPQMKSPTTGEPLYTYHLAQQILQTSQGPIINAIRESRDTTSLQGRLWSYQEGKGASAYSASVGAGFTARADAGNPWQLKYSSGEHGLSVGNLQWDDTTMRVDFTNYWNRHLGIYVQFIGTDGNAFSPPDWTDLFPIGGAVGSFFEPDATKKYVGFVQPIDEISGIPTSASPTTISFPVPIGASSVLLLAGGMGTGTFDKAVCLPGLLYTALFELAIPTAMMVVGAGLTMASDYTSLLKNHEVIEGLLNFFYFAFGVATDEFNNICAGDPVAALKTFAQDMAPLLLQKAIMAVLGKYLAQEAVEELIPYVDMIFMLYSVAVDLSLLAQTTAEVLMSPFVYKTEFTRKVDLTVTIGKDPQAPSFPQQATNYKVWGVYDNKATVAAQEFALASPLETSLQVTFRGIPSGGNITVFTAFCADDGWVAGQGNSGKISALSDSGTIQASITIKQNQVPLSSSTIYSHQQKLAYNGGYQWLRTTTPPATVPNDNPSIAYLTGMTIAQAPECIGYSWQGSDSAHAYFAQSMSIGVNPQSAYQVSAAYNSRVALCFDFASAASGGNNYFIDQSNRICPVAIGPSGCAGIPSGGATGGVFPMPMDDYALHPQGYVFGITGGNTSKIYRCDSLTPGGPLPQCTLLSGQGTRPGLINDPVAIDVDLEGVLLVLEAGNNRVQAFDICGNPIRRFNGNFWFSLDANVTYLDMAVEAKGYIYVLYHQNAGTSPSDYRMTVYKPDGTRLFDTDNIPAGRFTVDMWRNVYTVNYEQMAGRNEPTISLWAPSAP